MPNFAWSYSSLSAFETCPRRYYLTKVAKEVSEPQTDATLYGNRVHKALEKYVGDGAPLPDTMKNLTAVGDRVKAMPGTKLVEMKVALTRNLTPTEYFAKDVWYRGVFDVAVKGPKSVIVLDYKTGKRKFDGDQMRLFAATAFATFKYPETVHTGYLWLKENKLDRETYTKADVPPIWEEFSLRSRKIEIALETGKFPASPSGLCREWCPVGKSRCEHCGKN